MVLCLLSSLVVGGASVVVQGPLPGDVVTTKTMQALLGPRPAWAEPLSRTATFPLSLVLAAAASALAVAKSGWPAAALPPVAYVSALLWNLVLRAVIHVPRPGGGVVEVAKVSSDSGLPSTFALVYGCVLGVVVAGKSREKLTGRIVDVLALGLVTIGCAARVVLGGHWPSQVISSLLLAFGISFALSLAVPRMRS